MQNLPLATDYWPTQGQMLWRPSWCQSARSRKLDRVFTGVRFQPFYGNLSVYDEIEYEGGPMLRVVGKTNDAQIILERNNTHYMVPFDGVVCVFERERFDVPMSLIEEGTLHILEKADDKRWKVLFHDQEFYTTQDLSDEGLYDSHGKIPDKMMRLTGEYMLRPVLRGGVTPMPVKYE